MVSCVGLQVGFPLCIWLLAFGRMAARMAAGWRQDGNHLILFFEDIGVAVADTHAFVFISISPAVRG